MYYVLDSQIVNFNTHAITVFFILLSLRSLIVLRLHLKIAENTLPFKTTNQGSACFNFIMFDYCKIQSDIEDTLDFALMYDLKNKKK